MLKVGATRKFVNPWDSPVILVGKKDGSLWSYLDLSKLNPRDIKDAYSLPRIEESLNYLNGTCISTSVDLKAEYWQVKISDESIPCVVITIESLGFCGCVWVPFRLTSAPAAFW